MGSLHLLYQWADQVSTAAGESSKEEVLALGYKMVGDAIKSEYEIEIVIEQDNESELVFLIVLPEDA